MSEDDVTKVKINNQSIGIVGLKRVMEDMAREYAQKSGDELVAELLNRVSKENYIPEGAKDAYGEALLREFNKFLGRPFQEESSEGLEIKILGPGCARCDSLVREVMEVVAEMKLATAMEHVRDIREISSYGVMGTPALVVNT